MTPKWKDVDTGEEFIFTNHLFLAFLVEPIFFFCLPDNYTELCTVEVDLSQAPIYALPKTTGEGNFYRVDFDFILLFGMTELTAQVAWSENVSNFSYLFVQSNKYLD